MAFMPGGAMKIQIPRWIQLVGLPVLLADYTHSAADRIGAHFTAESGQARQTGVQETAIVRRPA